MYLPVVEVCLIFKGSGLTGFGTERIGVEIGTSLAVLWASIGSTFIILTVNVVLVRIVTNKFNNMDAALVMQLCNFISLKTRECHESVADSGAVAYRWLPAGSKSKPTHTLDNLDKGTRQSASVVVGQFIEQCPHCSARAENSMQQSGLPDSSLYVGLGLWG